MIEIGSTDASVGLEVGSDDAPLAGNCPCCETDDSPATYTVTVSAPGYFFDGWVVQLDLTVLADSCSWIGFYNDAPNEGTFDTYSDITLGPGVLTMDFIATDGSGDVWDSGGAPLSVDLFACSPWFYVWTQEIYLNGTATGDFITVTVTSVP